MFQAVRSYFGGRPAQTVPVDYKLSQNPDFAWLKLEQQQIFQPVALSDPNTPKPENHTRFVCISDTHTQTTGLEVPYGDVLIHAGDFSNVGLPGDVETFNNFLESLPHPNKVVIAGNHDISFDSQSYPQLYKRFFHKEQFDTAKVKALLTSCIYLEDSSVEINGFKIYGSPWQPEFGGWGFNLERGEACDRVWSKIPDNIDILITHGPPLGRGDQCTGGDRAGCLDLLRHVQQRIRPKLHVFGHIHEGYGVSSDGMTVYANASTCNFNYRPVNPPIVLDLPNP